MTDPLKITRMSLGRGPTAALERSRRGDAQTAQAEAHRPTHSQERQQAELAEQAARLRKPAAHGLIAAQQQSCVRPARKKKQHTVAGRQATLGTG